MIKVTLRNCMYFMDAVEELQSKGDFELKCALAEIAIAARSKIEVHNEQLKTVPGIATFQEEVRILKENNTIDKDGKKWVDAKTFMPLFVKSQELHATAIAAAEEQRRQANEVMDKPFEFAAVGISLAGLKALNEKEALNTSLLSKILPFVAKE